MVNNGLMKLPVEDGTELLIWRLLAGYLGLGGLLITFNARLSFPWNVICIFKSMPENITWRSSRVWELTVFLVLV